MPRPVQPRIPTFPKPYLIQRAAVHAPPVYHPSSLLRTVQRAEAKKSEGPQEKLNEMATKIHAKAGGTSCSGDAVWHCRQ